MRSCRGGSQRPDLVTGCSLHRKLESNCCHQSDLAWRHMGRCVWAEEEVEITNSKADYIFADVGAAEKFPELIAQPSEAQLLKLLKDIKGLYEAKRSKHVQGTSCSI